MSTDVTGDWMKALSQDTAIGQLLTGGSNGWFGIGQSLPDRETREPVWIPGKGYRINRKDGSQTHLTDQENRWWGIKPDDVTQRLEEERTKAMEGRLEARDARNRADDFEKLRISMMPTLKSLELQIAESQQRGRMLEGQLAEAIAARQEGNALQRAQLGVAEKQGDRQLSLQEGQLANANLIAKGQLELSRDNAAFNRDQAVYQNDLMAWRYAQEQANAERARISGIAESLGRAFASLKF